MKISAINTNYSFKKATAKTSSRKNYTNNTFYNKEQKTPFVVQTAEAIVTLFAKIKPQPKRASITIPMKPKEIKLDPKKLRELPAKLKRQAIEELNDAITAEDKTKVIKKYGIWA